MRQKAGIDLARHWTSAKLCRAGVATERKRIADQRRAVGTAEDERFVRFDAVTLGAAFHFGDAATCRRCCPRVSLTQSRDWSFILENSSFATDPYSVDQIAKGPSAARP